MWEFLSKYQELSQYFQKKLAQSLEVQGTQRKEDKDKQDLVTFSILLLISRLIPSFQLVDSPKVASEESKSTDLDEKMKSKL